MITIKHKHTNEVILEIESLCNADLRYTNLRGANLGSANLSGTNLRGADLRYADLSGTNLSEANLRCANLRCANLRGANLGSANLSYADLRDANLGSANLSYANLSYADLRGADLSYANLSGANLRWCIGNMHEIKSAQFDTYDVTWTKDTLAIGCQQHPIKDWWQFDDTTITNMDSDALLWWKKWKLVLQQIIEMSS